MQMFAQERLEHIMNILRQEGKILVKDMSQRFSLTEDCIRKDLKTLEKQGLIERIYGGAVLKKKSAYNIVIEKRKNLNPEIKKRIAKKAYQLLNENETIFLDISTINMALAQLIVEQNLKITVITNMVDIIQILAHSQNVEIICPGGVFYRPVDGFVGTMTIEQISSYNFHKAFLGSCGVDVHTKGITTFNVEDGNTKKAIIKNSKKVYLVMENEKFFYDGVYKFGEIQALDGIITEESPPQEISAKLQKYKIDVL